MTSKVNSRTILLIFLAVLCGLAGVYFLKRSLNKLPVVVRKEPAKLVTVPLASRDLKAGHQLVLDDIALLKMTREEMKKYKQIQDAFMTNPDQIIGRILDQDVERGSTFDPAKFFAQGFGPGIIDRIAPGRRAVTISLTARNALIGFAGAGQRVDVLFNYGSESSAETDSAIRAEANYFADRVLGTGDTNVMPRKFKDHYGPNGSFGAGGELEPQAVAKVVVRSAEILALGHRSIPTDNATGLSSQENVLVTLSVNASEVETLRVAERHGELSLALLSPEESLPVSTPSDGAKLGDLVEFPRNTARSITIYRGSEKTEVRFRADGSSVEERLVDSPSAHDPTTHPAYNPARNQPWSIPQRTFRSPGGMPVSTTGQSDSENSLPPTKPTNATGDSDSKDASHGGKVGQSTTQIDSAFQVKARALSDPDSSQIGVEMHVPNSRSATNALTAEALR